MNIPRSRIICLPSSQFSFHRVYNLIERFNQSGGYIFFYQIKSMRCPFIYLEIRNRSEGKIFKRISGRCYLDWFLPHFFTGWCEFLKKHIFFVEKLSFDVHERKILLSLSESRARFSTFEGTYCTILFTFQIATPSLLSF